ncbi:MAG: 1-acyl-sn-glycerol-3-phosphate acyltransferase [Actinobacteria bacterium]|nr:1-acyl-sn-glycerol-3-phosphate acyltransferase [Actinomycetota bacterium]MCB8996250.1 1-acyl-sn-glycerol-3-phosphate acyltransferase [Actinomycetota bacterium]MCB9413875.1 1-acyl-sn-glycerol-3-phosphate acyltransferase [Actinomycetota bacterium]HRY09214.1 lysophospholipid acyltransferase family protein [Candidatus Nanopelagicales bacterium]
MRQVGSLVFWAFVVLSSAVLFPVALIIWAVTAPFDRRRRALHLFTCFWASLYTWLNPAWRVTIHGREHLDRDATYVYVANHLSLLDILVLFRLFVDFKWVSKAEIFKVPGVGWNMTLNRYIPLQRGNRDSVVKMMAQCEQALAQGSSLMMFPEGTRSATGELKAFKTGAFELAVAAQVPIVPIAIEGTNDALPKHGFVLRGRHRITVTVLPPFQPGDSVEAATAQARERIAGVVG